MNRTSARKALNHLTFRRIFRVSEYGRRPQGGLAEGAPEPRVGAEVWENHREVGFGSVVNAVVDILMALEVGKPRTSR
jgi:hypothetical protein